MSRCEVLDHTINVDDAVYGAEYPPGIQPKGTLGLEKLNFASIDLWTCDQADLGTEVIHDFQVFLFSTSIEQPNPDEQQIAFAHYLFQGYTNSRGLIENASRTYGLELQYAESITVEKTPIGQPPFTSFTYTVTVPGASSPDYVIQGHVEDAGTGTERVVDGYFFLNATDRLNHFRITSEGPSSGSSGGIVSFGPGSYWGQRSDVDSWEIVNLPYANVTAELRFFDGI